MKLIFKYMLIRLRSAMQYKGSFALSIIAQLVQTVFSFAAIAVMFDRFGTVGGWSFGEASLCFGATYLAFALAESLFRGFDSFSQLVKSGDFDRVLVRPRSTVVQVLGSKFEFARVGRIIFAACVFGWAVNAAGIEFTPDKIAVLAGMIICGAVVFSGVFMLGAALCFTTVEGLEIVNVLTDGGRETMSYPLDIYAKPVVWFFTFVLPYACFNILPLSYLTGRAPDALHALAPAIGCLFIFPCLLVWKIGVGKYLSTGS